MDVLTTGWMVNTKHINIFLKPLAGQSFQGWTPRVPGTNGTKWRFCCGIQQKTAGLSQGRVREGSCLSWTPSHSKCLCLFFVFSSAGVEFWCRQHGLFDHKIETRGILWSPRSQQVCLAKPIHPSRHQTHSRELRDIYHITHRARKKCSEGSAGSPKHDHDHIEFISVCPIFSFLS